MLVNNAGYGLQAAVEEVTWEQIRRLFDVNLYGMIEMIRTLLPQLRRQGGGHIINISSVGGRVTAPLLGIYGASKFAVEGLTLGLAQEVAGQGIKVTAVEPGAFFTRFGSSAVLAEQQLEPYAAIREQMTGMIGGLAQGDPETLAEALLELADADDPPVQFIGGGDAYGMIEQELQRQAAEMQAWRPLSERANSRARVRTAEG